MLSDGEYRRIEGSLDWPIDPVPDGPTLPKGDLGRSWLNVKRAPGLVSRLNDGWIQ